MTDTPDRLNPLDGIDAESPLALDDCKDLAEALVVRQGTEPEPHWNDNAQTFIGAMIACMACFADGEERSLQSVRGILADPERMKTATQVTCASDRWGGMLARYAHQLLHPSDKERGSIISTANRHMTFLDSQAIAASTSGSTFDPAGLRPGKMTIYLVLPPDRMRAQAGLLRMWVNTTLRAVIRGGLQEKKLVHGIFDEAASLGRLESLNDLVDKYRGYGLRAQFYYQSQGQLHRCWPDDRGQTLLSNCSAVYFGVNDPLTAQEVSSRLGEETIVLESGGGNTGRSYSQPDGGPTTNGQGSRGSSSGENYGWAQGARKLLKPEEVLQLSPRTAITFIPGLPPVATTLIRHYEERFGEGPIRRAAAAFRVLLLSTLVLGLAALLAAALASIETPAPSEPQITPHQPKEGFRPFGGKGGWDV